MAGFDGERFRYDRFLHSAASMTGAVVGSALGGALALRPLETHLFYLHYYIALIFPRSLCSSTRRPSEYDEGTRHIYVHAVASLSALPQTAGFFPLHLAAAAYLFRYLCV